MYRTWPALIFATPYTPYTIYDICHLAGDVGAHK